MAGEYRNNHYVPQWYQGRFIPADGRDNEIFLLDLRPETHKLPDGRKLKLDAVKHTGPRRCFAVDDLYTTRVGGEESRDLEKVFFGDVDQRGRRAVEWFAADGWGGYYDGVLEDLMLFMSTQKLRTPKGLDWLLARTNVKNRESVLPYLTELQKLFGAIWAECVWQIVDASRSPTKLLFSDHPVTVYNHACAPGNPRYSRGPNDPDIRLHGTHTLFPLSSDRLLILTNRSWACNPYRPPLGARENPNLYRDAIFNFLEIHQGRRLDERDVLAVNQVMKRRAYRYVGAGEEKWLFPEREGKVSWRKPAEDALLMPDPRHLTPSAEVMIGYADGGVFATDSYGRLPGQPDYKKEMASGDEWGPLLRWQAEFRDRFGDEDRGGPVDRN